MNKIEIVQTIILIVALLFSVGAYLKAYLTENRYYSAIENIAGWIRSINKRFIDTPASSTDDGQE